MNNNTSNISYLNNILNVLNSIQEYNHNQNNDEKEEKSMNYNNHNNRDRDEEKNINHNHNHNNDEKEEKIELNINLDYDNNHQYINNLFRINVRPRNTFGSLFGNIFSHSITHFLTNYVQRNNNHINTINNLGSIIDNFMNEQYDYNYSNNDDYISEYIYNHYIYNRDGDEKESKDVHNIDNIDMEYIGVLLDMEEKVVENQYKDQECPICNEKYKKNVFLTSCTHHFHQDCLKKWIKEKNNCPICRHEF